MTLITTDAQSQAVFLVRCGFGPIFYKSTLQSQNAVSAHFTSEQIMPSGFARQKYNHLILIAGVEYLHIVLAGLGVTSPFQVPHYSSQIER